MKKFFQCAWIGMVLAFLYAPILILAVYSFTKSTMIGTIRGFSLKNYITLFTTPELLQMILGTIVLALVVATLSTILGTAGAVGTFYSKKNVQHVVELGNQIPVVNADVVTGFSICILLIVFFNMEKESFIPLLVGQMTLCTPFVYLQVMPRLQQMDPHLYEAALDLGCDTKQALVKVTLPQIWPAVLSGFITAITLSLDDYFVSTYTKPATFDTISTYVVNATKGSQTEIKTALWALSTIIFVLVVFMTIAVNKMPELEEES